MTRSLINAAKKVIIILLLSISIIGCYSSKALKNFPEYTQKKDKIKYISILSDIIVYNDGWEDGNIVNVPLSIQLSDSVLKKLESELKNRNYAVDKIYPPSVGFFKTDDTLKYKVYECTSDYEKDVDSLKDTVPPFHIQTDHSDPVLKMVFEKNKNLYDSSKTSAAADTGKAREYIFVFHLEGNNVSIGKSLGEALLTGFLTLGTVSVYSVSTLNAYYWIIDSETGQTILGDERFIKGEDISEENILDILMDFVEVIPSREA